MKKFAVFFTMYLVQVIRGGNSATLDTLQAQITQAEKNLHLQIFQTKSSIVKSYTRRNATLTSQVDAKKKEMSSGGEACKVWISQVDFVTKPINDKTCFKSCDMSSDIRSLAYRTAASLQEVRKNVERLNAICRLLIYNCEPQMDSVSGDLQMFHKRVVADLAEIRYNSMTCVSGKLKPIKDGLENIYNEWKTCK